MLGGAYSSTYKNIERQHVDTIKTLAENEKSDAIARAKKLSIETNRRRRALAIKRKSEAEREEKRRQQILAKRREKQQEATEKFQRGHIQSRPGSGSSSGRWSPRRAHGLTQLEDALKIVRGSPASSRASSARTRNHSSPSPTFYRQNTDPLSKPYFNKYAHPSINNGNGIHAANNTQHKQEELHNKSLRNLNNSRNLFEQQLESYQQSLLEQQQKTLREFNKQIMKEIEVDKNVVNSEVNGTNELERSESLSTVDSLEDGSSNDTLRESCDLNAFMTQKHEDGLVNGAKNVTFASDHKEAIKIYGNNSQNTQNAGNNEPKNIDSYSTQVQAAQASGQRSDEQKQQFYIQRQKEIQQQLQEQQMQQLLLQQRQQKELQGKVLEQQQKQQQLLQQQYERQKQEELEKQQHKEQKYLQLQNTASSVATTTTAYTNGEETKENQRPKAQMKAWATPSPHPPIPASTVYTTAQNYVTHASPYTGKNTHTNTTVHMVTTNEHSSKSSTPVNVYGQTTLTQNNYAGLASNRVAEKNFEGNMDVNKSEYATPPVSAQEKSLSFLETVTSGLTVTADSNSTNSTPTSVQRNQSNYSVPTAKSTQQVSKANGNTSVSTKPVTTSAVQPKPIHAGYYNSYGAAYTARQQLTPTSDNKQTATITTSTLSTKYDSPKMNGEVTWALPEGLEGQVKMMTSETATNGEDTADTDSVSTICEERDPEPKEVKSILKRTGSGKKTGGILKKSCSTGNMKEIRDSLEITRVHLQTSAEEKEQRMLRERERLNNPQPTPTKKNVRFADLCYDEEPDQNGGEGNDKLFVKRNNDTVTQKPPRPVSAVATKTFSPKIDSKPPRASSATVRTSTIPRAKTQIVRPQAAAHIITQSTQNLENAYSNEKVTIVNSNFMEKVPAMARANQTALSVTPASVYAVTSVNYSQPQQQKGNYAVSSIVMPKNESAPFIYPGYNKPGPVPSGSVNGPTQGGNNSKYDGAVYDDNGVRIDRTPTDEEINFLWDKLRNCLSRNSQATPDADSQPGGARQAAPVAHTYIDGNALGQFNSLNRVAQQPGNNQNNNPGIRRQNSLDSANNTYMRRYGLLQQRKQQPNPNSLKSRQQQQQQGYTVFQPPVQSNAEPQSVGPLINGVDVTESMAGFLAAEQLAEQSVSDSHIHQAIDEAQARQQVYNAARPQPKVKSALSIEEQRLMESLDRLNDKLKTAEVTNPNTTPQTQPPPQQYPQQQRQQAIHLPRVKYYM